MFRGIEYIHRLMIVIIGVVYYCWADETTNNTVKNNARNLTMIWLPNNEGLFAIFLALRVMFYHMDELGPSNRVLVIPPRHSTVHFSGKREDIMNMCSIFSLPPSRVICPIQNASTAKSLCPCIGGKRAQGERPQPQCLTADSLRSIIIQPPHHAARKRLRRANLCFKDTHLPMNGMRIHREVTLQAVTLPYPPFRISKEYAPLVSAFKRGIASLVAASVPLTVVHWRWPICYTVLYYIVIYHPILFFVPIVHGVMS